MKKSLLIFLLFPMMIQSCNNSNGFINPFPDDDYVKKGFNFTDEEKAVRVLNSKEIELINATLENDHDKYITKETAEIHRRSYNRAIIGEFKQGYDITNERSDETEETIRYKQRKDITNSHTRTVTTNKAEKILDYSYGRINEKEENIKYIHEEHEQEEENTNVYLRQQILRNEKEIEVSESSKPIGSYKNVDDADYEECYHIEQSAHIFTSHEHSGADRDDNVIVVKETKERYRDEDRSVPDGVIKFKDGRQYRAMKNSVTITKLKPIKTVDTKTEEEDDWYLATYVRKYSETTITSKVIEPNVPISFLNEPIVLIYEEEIRHFFSEPEFAVTTEKLPDITVKEKLC